MFNRAQARKETGTSAPMTLVRNQILKPPHVAVSEFPVIQIVFPVPPMSDVLSPPYTRHSAAPRFNFARLMCVLSYLGHSPFIPSIFPYLPAFPFIFPWY